jgi:predicted AAA+ superfamily ATPase
MTDAPDHLTLFPPLELPAELVRFNPWWQGRPGAALPATRRTLVSMIKRRLEQRLAPIVVVRGPRQIGKTTAEQKAS